MHLEALQLLCGSERFYGLVHPSALQLYILFEPKILFHLRARSIWTHSGLDSDRIKRHSSAQIAPKSIKILSWRFLLYAPNSNTQLQKITKLNSSKVCTKLSKPHSSKRHRFCRVQNSWWSNCFVCNSEDQDVTPSSLLRHCPSKVEYDALLPQ